MPDTSPDGLVYPRSVHKNAWYIHLEDEIIHADAIEAPVPSLSRGESGSFTFRFYVSYTQSDPPTNPTHLDRYRALLELDEHAGSYVHNETISNRQTYMEQLPAGARSLVVKLEPSYSTEARGVWGILDGVADSTVDEEAVVALELSIMKLADIDRYETRTALRSDLENGGP